MSTGKTPSSGQNTSNQRLQEKGLHSKSANPTRNPFPHSSESEEVIKNMSSVPCYLQRPEKEDTLQKKALNFGVLDWGTLEKWTYLQKQVATRRARNSPFSTVGSSNETGRSKSTREQNCRRRLRFPDSEAEHTKISAARNHEAENSLQEQCARIEGVWDHLQETVRKGRTSCDFAVASKERPGEVDRSSFANPSSSRVSHSCPFPSAAQNGKSVVTGPLQSGNEVAAHDTKGKHGKHDMGNVSDKPGRNEVKVPTSLRRELSPHRLLRAGINRIMSYSVHEEDEVAARGRRSPFRRMLNPLLKSNNNRGQFSRTRETRDISNSNKLPTRDDSNPSTSQVTNSATPVQDEKRAISTKQALLKLAWKNGLPLFIFSSNDDNILAATMGKRSIAEKNESECTYTLFTAHEVKKKGGNGKGQGHKVKKQGLVYNVVGRMKVSSSGLSSEDSKTYSVAREFVLFGGHLVPDELAAIVVKNNLREESFSSIVAILPGGAHGLSTVGEPSPLIKRWRNGGSCDCGGWDEGCMLTVLTDKAKERSSSDAAQSCAPDGNDGRCTELFNQGARAKEHVFAMVALKEGVYSVEFGPSIALLQAFAICIATLHSSTPTFLAKLHYSAEARSLQDTTLADYIRMATKKSREGA